MKKLVFIFCFLFSILSYGQSYNNLRVYYGEVIGSQAQDPSSILDVQSTYKGFLTPRMTTYERNNITNPATGLMIYNISTAAFNYYNGTTWGPIGGDPVITGQPQRIPYFGSTGQLTHDAGFYRDSIDGTTAIASVGGFGSYMLYINPGYLTLGKTSPTDTNIVVASGNTIQLAAQGEQGVNRIKAQDDLVQIEISNAARVIKTEMLFDTTSVSIITDSIFIVSNTEADTSYKLGLVKNEAAYFDVVTPISESSVFCRKDGGGIEFAAYKTTNRVTVDSLSSLISSESKFTGINNILVVDTNSIKFRNYDGITEHLYAFPTDTGSVGQVLTVATNDGLGTTTLSWDGSVVYAVKVVIPSADLLAYVNPIELVPAAGVGLFYDLISVYYASSAGANYANDGAIDQYIEISPDGLGGEDLYTGILCNSGTSAIRKAPFTGGRTIYGANNPIWFFMSGALVGGTRDLYLYLTYTVHKF